MKKTLIIGIIVAFIIGAGVASSAHASPAAPTFFEGISEWFGDVFTFGDVAKAERDIKKAEAIFQDLSANEGSPDDFIKKGFARYEKRIGNAKLHFENAKQKGKDVSSLGKTIIDVTDHHIGVLEAGKKQWGDKAENIGLLRALEVVKETNTRAREAIGQALEEKVENEQQTQKPETSGIQPSAEAQKKIRISSPVSFVGLWKAERLSVFHEGQWKEISVIGDGSYVEFKSDGKMCNNWTIFPKLSCTEYNTYTVNGDIIKITVKGVTELQRFRWSVKEGKLEFNTEIPDGNTWKTSAKWTGARVEFPPPPLPQKEKQAMPVRPRVVSIEVFPAADDPITGIKQFEIRCHGVSDEKPIVGIDIHLFYPGYELASSLNYSNIATPLDTLNPKDQVGAALFDVEIPLHPTPPKISADRVYKAYCLSFTSRDGAVLSQSAEYHKTFTLP